MYFILCVSIVVSVLCMQFSECPPAFSSIISLSVLVTVCLRFKACQSVLHCSVCVTGLFGSINCAFHVFMLMCICLNAGLAIGIAFYHGFGFVPVFVCVCLCACMCVCCVCLYFYMQLVSMHCIPLLDCVCA